MTEPRSLSRTPKQHLRLFLNGLLMGTADIIPGVSGGTMAFLLGIYEELLNAIKAFDLKLLQLVACLRFREAFEHVPWRFLLALGLGILTAVATLARLLSWLLDHHPVFVFAFFFGLILASILAVGARVRWSAVTAGALLAGTVIAYVIVGLVPLQMPHDPLTLFLSGMVAIMAMILPGISGAFLLLILGQYTFVLNAVKSFNLVALLPVALGAVVGITSFARVLSWLLRRYEQATVAALVGFMVGSLRRIWPWKETLETTIDRHGQVVPLRQANILPDPASGEFWAALLLCLLGFLLVSVLDHQQSRSNPLLRGVGRRARGASADG